MNKTAGTPLTSDEINLLKLYLRKNLRKLGYKVTGKTAAPIRITDENSAVLILWVYTTENWNLEELGDVDCLFTNYDGFTGFSNVSKLVSEYMNSLNDKLPSIV